MIYYLPIIVSVIGLSIATYTDLKERIVTNKLNFGLAGIGLILYGIIAVMENSPIIFLMSILGLMYGFVFGWILWKLGIFAGGDVKLFMALGALNPLTPALVQTGILTTSNTPLFPITLFIYSLVSFLPYGFLVVLQKLSKNKEFRKKLWIETKKRIADGINLSVFSGALYTIFTTTQIPTLIVLPLIIIWGLRKERNALTVGATLAAIIISPQEFVKNIFATLIIVVIIYGIIKLMLSLRPLLVSEVNVSKLEEGMIPAKTLVWKGKKVVEIEPLSIASAFMALKKRKTTELLKPRKEIISAMKARGLINEEIKELKTLAKKGLISKKMQIKESMPFVPTMLIGYIICLIAGDAIWIVIFGL